MINNLILKAFCLYLLRTQGNRIPEFAGSYSDTGFSTLPFPSVKEHFRKVGMPEDSKYILLLRCYLIFATHVIVNLNCGREIYLPPIVTPLTQLMDRGVELVRNLVAHGDARVGK